MLHLQGRCLRLLTVVHFTIDIDFRIGWKKTIFHFFPNDDRICCILRLTKTAVTQDNKCRGIR